MQESPITIDRSLQMEGTAPRFLRMPAVRAHDRVVSLDDLPVNL